jgi:hypothetical protein
MSHKRLTEVAEIVIMAAVLIGVAYWPALDAYKSDLIALLTVLFVAALSGKKLEDIVVALLPVLEALAKRTPTPLDDLIVETAKEILE